VNTLLNPFLVVYAGLFPIVNPVGSAPIFLALTSDADRRARASLAARVALNSFLLLLGSLFIGSHVLSFFGITLPVLRVGGGLAVASFGWQMLQGGAAPGAQGAPVEQPKSIDSFYPLTMPLTVGPGSISVAIALGAQWPREPASLASTVLLAGAAVLGLAAIALTVFLCYRFADRMTAMLGASGINVMVRLSAFILLCIGIQILWGGLSVLLGLPRA
jgi:multiple antibiotic resistance protein